MSQIVLLVVTIFFAISIYFLRRKQKPPPKSFSQSLKYEPRKTISDRDPPKLKLVDVENIADPPPKTVEVIFTWNGHAWDAFEVLGIPMGSTMPEIVLAYEEALKKVDPQSQEFIKRAYQSICEKLMAA